MPPGLRASRPRRRRAGEATSTAEKAARQAVLVGDRKAKRARLRAVLDGAPEDGKNELPLLARWILDDSERQDGQRGEEREILAEEMQFAMRKLVAAAKACKDESAQLRLELEKLKAPPDEPDFEEGIAEDVLRAAAGGHAEVGEAKDGAADVASAGEAKSVASDAKGAKGAAAKGGKDVATVTKKEDKGSMLQRVDAATSETAPDLPALSELLKSEYEDVAIKAALATAAVCARDGDMQQQLADVGGLPRIVALLDGDYSNRGLLDLTLCVKALTANRMHHPMLLQQFVQAGGPKKLVRIASGPESDVAHAALQIIRSLADAQNTRKALLKENVLPPLIRCLRPAMPMSAVDPASAALACFVRFEGGECCQAVLNAQGIPPLVKLLQRGADTRAAHSAASTIASLASSPDVGPDAQKRARDAGALEALLPLLDGVLGGNGGQAATAEAVCKAMAELCRGSSAISTEFSSLGGLQSLVGLLSAPAAPPLLRVAACETIASCAASDSNACPEMRRLGAVPLLAGLVTGGTKAVAEAAQGVLTLLQQRGDESMAHEVASAMANQTEGSAPSLVAQLSQGNKLARRSAVLLDSMAQASPAAKAQIIKLGVVPKLVKMTRAGPHDVGTLNALGALEVLAQGTVAVQDEAREAGIFQELIPLLRPSAGTPPAAAPVSDDDIIEEDGAPAPTGAPAEAPEKVSVNNNELRTNAALCLVALVKDNRVSQDKAKQLGAVEAVATLLDGDHEWEGSYLAAVAMQALGLPDPKSQETAVAPVQAAQAANKSPDEVAAPTGRLGTLRSVWGLKTEPDRWRREG